MNWEDGDSIKRYGDVRKQIVLGYHSSTLAWKIPWMEEPGRLQSMVKWVRVGVEGQKQQSPAPSSLVLGFISLGLCGPASCGLIVEETFS